MRVLPCIILGMQAHSCSHKFHLAPNSNGPGVATLFTPRRHFKPTSFRCCCEVANRLRGKALKHHGVWMIGLSVNEPLLVPSGVHQAPSFCFLAALVLSSCSVPVDHNLVSGAEPRS